jgi:hypothetical protein
MRKCVASAVVALLLGVSPLGLYARPLGAAPRLSLALRNSALVGTIGATSVSPNVTPAGVPLAAVVTSSITDPSLIPDSVNLQKLDQSGRVVSVVGTLHDDGLNGDTVAGDNSFSISTTIFETDPGVVRLRVSAAFRGSLLRSFSALMTVNITGTATGVTILSPANTAYLNTSPVTISGTVGDPSAHVTVNGIAAPVSGNSFVATVPLNEGPNTLTAVATNSNNTTSTTSTLVTLDTTPPHVAIYSPTNDGVTTEAAATVTGLVNDIVVGTVNSQQATVTVNGVAAQVINRTFTATNIPLTIGANSIQVTGVDRAGNGATTTLNVTRQALTQTTLRVSAGNGQTGPIGGQLSAPLVAQLLDGTGQPVPNTPVVFRVTGLDGTLSPNGNPGTGLSSIAINTNAQGLAAARLTLGSRAGAGNNIVEASTTGVASTAVFTASATSAMPGLIIVDTGNSQSGVIGQPLALPFIAVVTDASYNRLAGVQVTFTVKQGGGSFAGQPTFVATSDSDGRVLSTLKLGPEPGVSNNVVEASFAGNGSAPAAFTASGLAPGPANATRISGVVLDNSNNPLAGVTMRLFQINQGNNGNVPQQVATPALTGAQGQFVIQPAPVGIFKLMADGGTAQRPGSWPTLEYDIVTVSGQDNTVGLPIYLPELLANNRLCVSPTTGGTLTIPQAPGFSLTIAPGSATFPGGSRTGCVSVTPVNMDKVPMAPGFGQQPRFVVTIQPVGTTFNQPAAITIPNVDGLTPRAVTEMYSYDHDLAAFVAIGTGTVSDDGSVIRSDPGVGVLKAGWHCGGNPNQTGSTGSLSLSASPTTLSGNLDDTFSVTARGTPPLDGEYRWEIVATQAGDDTSIVQLTSAPTCASQPSCVAQLKAIKGGQATLRVHFRCTTTGLEATPVDIRISVTGFKGVLTARDNFTGRSTTRFGIAEIIDLSFTANPPATAASLGGLQWRLTSGGGTLNAGSADGMGTYTAPDTAATVVLRLEVASGPSQGVGKDYTITIITPSGGHLTRFSGLRHTMGFASVGFQAHIYLEPANVSFANLFFSEGTVAAVASGFYAVFNGIPHSATATPIAIGNCNITTGCLGGTDTVDTNDKGPPFSVGDFLWAIPWQYKVTGGTLKNFTVANHHQMADAAGKATIEKAGAGPFSKNANDPPSSY